MSLISRELREVWDALRAAKGQRNEDLAEVRIRNLRGIWDLRFSFPYPVTVLAGPEWFRQVDRAVRLRLRLSRARA